MNFNTLVICILCILGSAWFGNDWYSHRTMAVNSKDWYCVTGKMQVVTVEESHTIERSKYGGERKIDTYTPHVSYSYSYKGHHYRGNVIGFPNPTFDNLKESKSFQSKYSEGSPVTIWFDPKSPARSCLSTGLRQESGSEFLLAIILLALGVAGLSFICFNNDGEYANRPTIEELESKYVS